MRIRLIGVIALVTLAFVLVACSRVSVPVGSTGDAAGGNEAVREYNIEDDLVCTFWKVFTIPVYSPLRLCTIALNTEPFKWSRV